jgi:hypothetical protein
VNDVSFVPVLKTTAVMDIRAVAGSLHNIAALFGASLKER